jgi:hypothetical protein
MTLTLTLTVTITLTVTMTVTLTLTLTVTMTDFENFSGYSFFDFPKDSIKELRTYHSLACSF